MQGGKESVVKTASHKPYVFESWQHHAPVGARPHEAEVGLLLGLQVSIPLWALVHLPVVVTLSTAAFTPNGWVHSILYVLFENAMGIVKLGAVIAGVPSV